MKREFLGVQALRFIAAGMVVLTHATFYAHERNDPSMPVWHFGEAGVDIFFVISGFVIVLASQRDGSWVSAKSFLYRRIVRIIPMYWLATSINVAVLALLPQLVLHSDLNWLEVVKSYLLIPGYNSDGSIEPLVGVAWTLYFESFFYAIFAISLAFGARPLLFVPSVMAALAVLWIFRSASDPAIFVYAHPIVLEFVAGMFIAKYLTGIEVSRTTAFGLLTAGFALLVGLGEFQRGLPHLIFRGLPSVMIVAGAVLSEKYLPLKKDGALVFLGAASYTLYLFHPMAGPIAPVVLSRLGISSGIISVALSCLLALSAAVVIYVIIESPLNNFLRRSQSSRRSPSPAS